MSQKLDWEARYKDLLNKYLKFGDMAFKMGIEEGMRKSEIQSLAEDQAEIAEEEAMFGEEVPMEEGLPMEEGMEEGTELDSHIGELEGMVAKGEKPSFVDIRNLVSKIKDTRVKPEVKMVKSEKTENEALLGGIISTWKDEKTTAIKKSEDAEENIDLSKALEEANKLLD